MDFATSDPVILSTLSKSHLRISSHKDWVFRRVLHGGKMLFFCDKGLRVVDSATSSVSIPHAPDSITKERGWDMYPIHGTNEEHMYTQVKDGAIACYLEGNESEPLMRIKWDYRKYYTRQLDFLQGNIWGMESDAPLWGPTIQQSSDTSWELACFKEQESTRYSVLVNWKAKQKTLLLPQGVEDPLFYYYRGLVLFASDGLDDYPHGLNLPHDHSSIDWTPGIFDAIVDMCVQPGGTMVYCMIKYEYWDTTAVYCLWDLTSTVMWALAIELGFVVIPVPYITDQKGVSGNERRKS